MASVLTVILGVLLTLVGISLVATPLVTFLSAGYFIIILFFVTGIFGIVSAISEKRYGADFVFSILSLILGIVGFAVPGAGAMNSFLLLYLAAGWFIVHGVLSIVTAIANRNSGEGSTAAGIVLGVLELILGIYSIVHPEVLAVGIGLLIGIYFIETGISRIVEGAQAGTGGNGMTILFAIIGILAIIGGISMIATPLLTFVSVGYWIVMLCFICGVIGIVRGFIEKRFDLGFVFSLLRLILGIIGFAVPGVADMNSYILLYMAAGWFIVHGVLSIITAIQHRKEGGGIVAVGILLGVLELILGGYSIAYPVVLALSLGLLTGFFFIETGINIIVFGSAFSKNVEEVQSAA